MRQTVIDEGVVLDTMEHIQVILATDGEKALYWHPYGEYRFVLELGGHTERSNSVRDIVQRYNLAGV